MRSMIRNGPTDLAHPEGVPCVGASERCACRYQLREGRNMTVTRRGFGKTREGCDLALYTIKNDNDMSVCLTDLGAAIVSIMLPDRNGTMRDVVLGYDDAEGYYSNICYFGAVVGRSCNRIDGGKFHINGKEYQLALNGDGCNLHSGPDGFEQRQWQTEKVTDNSVCFHIADRDGQQGYPGNFEASITYTLTSENELILHYEGNCDRDTIANMTNHIYFNLEGHDSGDILQQELMLTADYYTPVWDSRSIPAGEIAAVKGTPMDFAKTKRIGLEIDADFEQLKFAGGYDHNFVIKTDKGKVEKFAEAYSPKTGIRLKAYTDLPGVQFYAGNFITPQTGKGGAVYAKRQGFCLETQYYPNSINQEGFAKPLLKAGEKYETVTCYKFSVE